LKIIISPAKKMNTKEDSWDSVGLPYYLDEAKVLMEYLRGLDYKEVKEIWNCNDKIAKLNYLRLKEMDLLGRLTPAIIAYEGLQFLYMKPEIFTEKEMEYLQGNLRILSGFYGVLKPLDGVIPHRLEMQAKIGMQGNIDGHSKSNIHVDGCGYNNLYDFWNDKIYQEIITDLPQDGVILNLASKEYSKAIMPYISSEISVVECVFGSEFTDKDGKVSVKVKGTQAKMARGAMVRYLAENQIKKIEDIKGFDGLNFRYQEKLSDEKKLVFLPISHLTNIEF
jgi:cytoplasmic iron level regulating protein YaaA (DUF328/UPF0246 family)